MKLSADQTQSVKGAFYHHSGGQQVISDDQLNGFLASAIPGISYEECDRIKGKYKGPAYNMGTWFILMQVDPRLVGFAVQYPPAPPEQKEAPVDGLEKKAAMGF